MWAFPAIFSSRDYMTVSEWIWLDRTKISSTADRSVSGLSQTQGPVQARALALKGKLFRQGAQNHFLSVCIYNSNRFVDCLTAATSNRRETWVKKHGTDGILCRQVPVPGYGAWILPSERVPVPGYRAQVFVQAPLKCYVHIGAQAPNPRTKSGRARPKK